MGSEIKSIYAGKMVSDVDNSAMKPNDYPRAVNLRHGLKGGVVTNVLGNTGITVVLPSGTNRTICDAKSTDDHKIYYINYNQNLKHTLVELDTITNTAFVVLENLTDTNGVDIFKLKPDVEISSARIINGGDFDLRGNPTNKLLLFVYEGSEPRCINIGKITKYGYPGVSTLSILSGKLTLSNTDIKAGDKARFIRIGSQWAKTITIIDGHITIPLGSVGVGQYQGVVYSSTGAVRLEDTLLAKAPPIFPITTAYFTDYSFTANNLRSDLYQFIYSYEYSDYEQSVWSVTSDIKLPDYEIGSSGADVSKNNAIKATVHTGGKSVRKIRIGYRRMIVSPNDYYEAIVLDKDQLNIADDTTYDYVFYNNANTRAIPFAEINNIDFDRVPLEAGCLEVLNNGSLALGDITEGYDLEPVNISGSVVVDPAEISLGISQVLNTAKAGSKYKIGVVYGEDRGRRTSVLTTEAAVVVTQDIKTSGNRQQKISWSLTSTPPLWATWFAIVMTKNLTHKDTYYGIASSLTIRIDDPKVVYANIENLAAQEKVYGPDYVSYAYAQGDRFKWLRLANSATYLNKIFDSEILDCKAEIVEGVTPEKTNRVIKLRNTSDIPLDIFTANSQGDLISEPFLFEAYTPKVTGDFDNVFFHTGNVFKIDNPGLPNRTHSISSGIINNLDCFIKTRSIPYSEGDVSSSEDSIQSSARLTYQFNADENAIDHVIPFDNSISPGNTWSGTEYTVASSVELNIRITFSCFVKDIYDGGSTPATRLILQVNKGGGWVNNADIRFGTSGYAQPTSYPDQVLNSKITVAEGDKIRLIAHHEPGAKRVNFSMMPGAEIRFSSPKMGAIVEDFNFDDFHPSSLLTLGTPTIVDDNFRRVRRKSTVFHTDPFIPNTNINGLNRIYAGYFKDYDLNHGAIKRLISRGNYLIAIKESQSTNIPVGATIISNAAGATQLGLSTELLNDEQPYAGGYGISSNATGVVDTGKNLFLIDAVKGCFARLGLDGYEDVGILSLFSQWINDKCQIYKSTKDKIKIGYDLLNKEVVILFAKVGDGGFNETLVYSEINQGFMSFFSIEPDHVAHLGTAMYAFHNGVPYLQNSGISYNTWFGETYKTQLDLIFNENYSIAKIFRSIRLWASRIFSPVNLNTDLGCATNMEESLFDIDVSTDLPHGLITKSIDGVFLAPIPMDVNSDGGIIDGDPMRGKILQVDFESDLSATLLEIQGVMVISSDK